MGAGFIPVVDQVLDVRDFSAHIYYMASRDEYNSPSRWLDLSLTGIGAIPIIGSAVKGLGKLAIKHGDTAADYASELFATIRKVKPDWGNVDNLKAVIDANWNDGVIATKIFLNTILDVIDEIIPGWTPGWTPVIGDIKNGSKKIRDSMASALDSAFSSLKSQLDDFLNKFITDETGAITVGRRNGDDSNSSGVGILSDTEIARRLEAAQDNLNKIGQIVRDEKDAIFASDTFTKLNGTIEYKVPYTPPPISSKEFEHLNALNQELSVAEDAVANLTAAAKGLTTEVIDFLRASSPPPSGSTFRKNWEETIERGPNGKPIDWITGKEIVENNFPADHILPFNIIINIDGFGELPREVQLDILNNPANLYPTSPSLNSSRMDRDLATWLRSDSPLRPSDISTTQRNIAFETERRATAVIRQQIDDALRDNGLLS